jgi:hypothetical protein
MSNLAQKRINLVGFFALMALSAVTMVWFFWHHPVTTAIVTIVVLAAFAISARLAQLVDSDGLSHLKRGKRAGFR